MAEEMHNIKTDAKSIVLTGKSGELTVQVSDGNGFEFDHIIMNPTEL
jgi:hypothetical protein